MSISESRAERPPIIDDEPRVPRREHALPVVLMGELLIRKGADLGDEAACMAVLRDWGIAESDIDAGLSTAIDRARSSRQVSDTPIRAIGDLIACIVAVVAILLWAIPSHAAELAARQAKVSWTAAWVAIVYVAVVFALLACSFRRGNR